MNIPFVQVDAFTDKAYSGNPAGVCILSKPQDGEWMQKVANEMNLSETAFLLKEKDDYRLRWFTPKIEVDLCGHATLAAAHVLWEDAYLDPQKEARFHTRSGLLTARGHGTWIELNFPMEADRKVPTPPNLTEAMGVIPKYVGKNRMDYLVEVESESMLRKLEPDLNLLKTIDTRGIIVTSISDSKKYDFISRFFAPRAGIDEDPVTGSAHCCLGPFWRRRFAKNKLVAYQASSRGGVIRVRLADKRVYLSGQAVTVLRGELLY